MRPTLRGLHRWAGLATGADALEDIVGRDSSRCFSRYDQLLPEFWPVMSLSFGGDISRHMPETPYDVQFICTGNSARSIMAEAILNKLGEGKFRAYSAGSHPTGTLNPHALDLLTRRGYDTSALRSKSWNEFVGPDAPVFNFVFTVCDNAAGEVCPVWPGQPINGHWGVPDPAAVEGTPVQIARAFEDALKMLTRRIALLTALPIHQLDQVTLQARAQEIGGESGV
jgi:arsenate reductase